MTNDVESFRVTMSAGDLNRIRRIGSTLLRCSSDIPSFFGLVTIGLMPIPLHYTQFPTARPQILTRYPMAPVAISPEKPGKPVLLELECLLGERGFPITLLGKASSRLSELSRNSCAVRCIQRTPSGHIASCAFIRFKSNNQTGYGVHSHSLPSFPPDW